MPIVTSKSSGDAASGVTRHSLVGLFITSAHHAYGAYVYSTPWRYHAVFIAGAAALVLLGSLAVLRARPAGPWGTLARWHFVLTALVVPVLMFGVFEGFYNHLVKDVLYFAGLPAEQLTRLFPPPRYEMPNDALFEISGVLQIGPAALVAKYLYRMSVEYRAAKPARPAAHAPQPSGTEEDACEGAHAAN